jgi:hypothetical protein
MSQSGENEARTVLLTLAAVFGGAVLLFGCLFGYVSVAADRGFSFVIVNHSGRPLQVTIGDHSYSLENGSLVEAAPSSSRLITAEANGSTWQYRWEPVGREWVARTSRRKLAYLQIEPDGSAFLVPAAVDRPIDNLPDQPPGYPLRPTIKRP